MALEELKVRSRTWLITGVAGFIGSNLLETLLKLDQKIVGLDNFATGKPRNLEEVKGLVTRSQWARFRFLEGDIRDPASCRQACRGVEHILHQAALGSVPRSIEKPVDTHLTNVDGSLNMLVAARAEGVRSFVYASSSSVYGDHPALPKVEENIGAPLSPYAVSKRVTELYAEAFAVNYRYRATGLRYFNVFGKRQDPDGPYAAVIPRWISSMIAGQPVMINGDGETSRDFCHVANVVQANLLAAVTDSDEARAQVYNIAVGGRTTLNQLFELIRSGLAARFERLASFRPSYGEFRPGDVRHSQADIAKAKKLLGYEPTHQLADGIRDSLPWYVDHLN